MSVINKIEKRGLARACSTQGADLLAGDAITLSGRAIDLQAVSNETRSHSVEKSSSLTTGSALAGPLGSQIAAMGEKGARLTWQC